MEQLQGRTAIVTGAASGIGLAVAAAFVDAGMRVVMADVDEDNLRSQAARLADQGGEILAVTADVRDPDAVERVGAAALEHFGKLHVAVNNAESSTAATHGRYPSRTGTASSTSICGRHPRHPLLRASHPRLRRGGPRRQYGVHGGRPVLGPPRALHRPKHGVLGLSDVLRAELESLRAPIGVSVVMPGMIKTGMNPIGTVSPATVAANVLDAMRRRRSYVFTDDHSTDEVADRLQAILSARLNAIS